MGFYIASARIVIELDGSRHDPEEGVQSDQARDAYLRSKGLRILRYSNPEVKRDFAGIYEDILLQLDEE